MRCAQRASARTARASTVFFFLYVYLHVYVAGFLGYTVYESIVRAGGLFLLFQLSIGEFGFFRAIFCRG